MRMSPIEMGRMSKCLGFCMIKFHLFDIIILFLLLFFFSYILLLSNNYIMQFLVSNNVN